jgi:hypothetical protein
VALWRIPLAGETEHGPHRRAVGSIGVTHPRSPSKRRPPRQTLARSPRCSQRHLVDTEYRSALEVPTRTLPSLPNLPPSFSEVDRGMGLSGMLEALAEDLEERGEIDLSEYCIDGTFVVAKRGRGSKDQAGQSYEDHGVFRRLLCSTRPPHRECFAARGYPR